MIMQYSACQDQWGSHSDYNCTSKQLMVVILQLVIPWQICRMLLYDNLGQLPMMLP